MRKSIAASIRISEIRDRLVELDGIETRSAEQDTEQASLMAERTTKEAEFRSESKSEEEAQLHPRDFDVLPETRERLEIRSKTGLLDFFAAAAGGREVSGSAREYASACGVAPLNRLPLSIFTDGQPETRAITPGPAVKGALQPIVPYLFERSAAASLGIDFPSVPMGQVQIPKVGTAPPSDTLAKDGTAPATAAAVSLVSQGPVRIAGQFETRVEDTAVMALEDALSEAMQGSLSNELDEQVFNGAAGELNGLFTQAVDVAAASSVETMATGIARYAKLVDGRHAYDLSDLRAVIGPSRSTPVSFLQAATSACSTTSRTRSGRFG